MAKKAIFKLMDIVMFVITTNPSAIKRMKERKGGFFKGTVIRVTRTDVWIKPLNKSLLDRLRGTSFFRQAWKMKGRFITKEELNKCGYCLLEDDDLHKFNINHIERLYNTNKVELVEYVVIPKKQVAHFYGEHKRLTMALEKLKKTDLVKKNTKKKTHKKSNKWVYTV